MVNWTAVAIGFVVTVILETIGILFISVDAAVSTFISIFAPIIGGLIAAYWAGGTYKEGIANGGLAGGMGSLIAAIIFLPGSLIYIAENAVISFISSAILGVIGGLIGILSKRNPEEKEGKEKIKEEPPSQEKGNS
jgi:sugar phosphate permease